MVGRSIRFWGWDTHFAGKADGIGIFLRNGLFGVDLDNSVRANGFVALWARQRLGDLRSFTDISPSGTGLKVLTFADMDRFRDLEQVQAIGEERLPHKMQYGGFGGEVEGVRPVLTTLLHDHRSHASWLPHQRHAQPGGREVFYLAVFDDRLQELAAVLQSQRESLAAYAVANPGNVSVEDQVVVDMASLAKNGEEIVRLWNGDMSDYDDDHSAADLGLCSKLAFWVGPNPERVDRLFRQSGLYRAKWDRDDYRRWTLHRAINLTRYYDWSE